MVALVEPHLNSEHGKPRPETGASHMFEGGSWEHLGTEWLWSLSKGPQQHLDLQDAGACLFATNQLRMKYLRLSLEVPGISREF